MEEEQKKRIGPACGEGNGGKNYKGGEQQTGEDDGAKGGTERRTKRWRTEREKILWRKGDIEKEELTSGGKETDEDEKEQNEKEKVEGEEDQRENVKSEDHTKKLKC